MTARHARRAAIGDAITVDGVAWRIYALGELDDGTPVAFAREPEDPGAVMIFTLAPPAWTLAPTGPMQ